MDLIEEEARLLKRDAEWAALASTGTDVDRILSYWTDDAVLVAPGMPSVVGKTALREYVLSSLDIPGFNITWTSGGVHLSPDGNVAYMFARNAVTMNGADGEPVTTVGRAVTIWRRDLDGQWRCAVDIWNAGPVAEP